ncbi:FprA family A-type flavoprotein [Methanobrevibacter filiformis]|uniref:Nitric oxide reductase n=1 Tax=Methanobrevibacter filiformis TaxID=55758 RepID=A0A166FD37_9EURY|nr:FprA family A-type flavoprotein [Methanobrevibacter filiformis]KZX17554.1 nitric oxide reductase [Methanobrevibacter filiformis]
MKSSSKKINDGVYWVGVLDWDIRDYHGYKLDGTTYNCYLVFGKDKVALIDNSYPGTFPSLWGKIVDAFEKEGRDLKIDVVIQNHIEIDHSGTLPQIIKKFPELELYCSAQAVNGLKNYFPNLENFTFNIVKTGDTLDLGGKNFTFISAPMLHWPDSMFSLLHENGILFSNDAFGQHLCLSERFSDETSQDLLIRHAKKFYANLVTPSSSMVINKLKELVSTGLVNDVKIIAPSHGQIWRDPSLIINAYSDWASGVCKDKVTFIYDTMHHSTQKMVNAMIEGVLSEDVEVKSYFLHEDERSAAVTDVLDSKAVCIGSPTMMNNPYPSLGDLIYYFNCLSFSKTGKTKKAVVFGSKGWGGGANKKLSADLKEAGFEIFEEYDTLNIPSDEILNECFEIGKKLGQTIKSE